MHNSTVATKYNIDSTCKNIAALASIHSQPEILRFICQWWWRLWCIPHTCTGHFIHDHDHFCCSQHGCGSLRCMSVQHSPTHLFYTHQLIRSPQFISYICPHSFRNTKGWSDVVRMIVPTRVCCDLLTCYYVKTYVLMTGKIFLAQWFWMKRCGEATRQGVQLLRPQ